MNESNLKTDILNSRTTIISGIILIIFNAGFIFSFSGSRWFSIFCSVMEYDRALILKGEIWRFFTCHLVHWSPAHFLLDSVVFVFQGITFEQKIGKKYWMALFLSSLFIGVSLLIFRSDLMYYRGISGIINTQLVLGSGLFIFDKTLSKNMRSMFSICFLIHMIKIIYESVNRAPFFSTHLLGDMGLFTPVAHLSGVVLGFLLLAAYLLMPFSGKRQTHEKDKDNLSPASLELSEGAEKSIFCF